MLNQVNSSYGYNTTGAPRSIGGSQSFVVTNSPYGINQQVNCGCQTQGNSGNFQLLSTLLQQITSMIGAVLGGLLQVLSGKAMGMDSSKNVELPLNKIADSKSPELLLPGSDLFSQASDFLGKLKDGAGFFQETLGNIGSFFNFSKKGGIFSKISKIF